LRDQAQALGVLYASYQAPVDMIEARNVLGATCWAFKATLQTYPLPVLQAARVVVDGPLLPELKGQVHEGWIKGDARSFAIALASIVAKVERDAFMQTGTHDTCGFSFDRHKGYGTALHRQELLRCGPSRWHRQAFVKTFLSH
jgi:ribonuclease HII